MVEVNVKSLGLPMTVVALVNGMIGGTILVLPLTSLAVGYGYTILIVLVTGFFSFYSCYIGIIHLGDQKDLDTALLRHFNGNRFFKIFYDFCVWMGIMVLLILYFQLIVIQWEGLVPPYNFSYVNVLVNAAVIVLWCLVLNFFELGAHMMGYGVASIIGYLIFLIWVVATKPSGPRVPEAFGTGVAGFASMMGSAFSIQGFFIPVLRSHTNSSKHVLILFLAYVFGTLAYYFIAFMGAYGIANRPDYQNTATIESYFQSSQWQVKLLEGIYLVHLYSVFPEYMIVCKKRFFSIFGLRETGRKQMSLIELVYIIAVVGVCLVIAILQVDIDIIIDINGSVLGFCFIYLIPSLLHIKCLYFSKGKRHISELQLLDMFKEEGSKDEQPKTIQDGIIANPSTPDQLSDFTDPNEIKEHPEAVQIQMFEIKPTPEPIYTPNRPSQSKTIKMRQVEIHDGKLMSKLIGEDGVEDGAEVVDEDYSYFYCGYEKPVLWRQILSVGLLGVMFLIGIFIMVNGLIEVNHMISNE